MPPEHSIAMAGLAFLVVGGLQLFLSVRRGRELCRRFADRQPDAYAEAGSPLPGYFDSPRRHAYFHFVLRRQYQGLGDPLLVEEFDRLRVSELRQLVFLVGGFAALGVAFVWLRWVRGG